jgi:hypothetical protein
MNNKKALSYIKAALRASQPGLQQTWNKTASAKGWSASLSEQVNVTTGLHGVAFNYPDDVVGHINAAEYGDMGKPPQAAMREFVDLSKKEIDRAVMQAATKYFAAMGLLK